MPSKGDIKFGQLAVELDFTSKDKIEEALRLQAQLEKQGKVTSLDRIMLKKGILDAEQIQEIEKKQGRRIVFCPECSNKLNVAIFGPGTRIRCPKCDTSLTVPSGVKYEVVDRKEPPAKKPAKAERAGQDTIKVKKTAAPAKKKPAEEDDVEVLDDEPKDLDDAIDLLDEDGEGDDDLGDDLADDVEVLDEGGDDDDFDLDDDKPKKKSGGDDDDLEILEDLQERPKTGPGKKPAPAPKKPEPPRGSSRIDKFKKK